MAAELLPKASWEDIELSRPEPSRAVTGRTLADDGNALRGVISCCDSACRGRWSSEPS